MMNRLAFAAIPLAVFAMGFSDKKIDASDGAAYNASIQAMIAPLDQAKKEELVMAVFAVSGYHHCLADRKTRGRKNVKTDCGNAIPTIPRYAKFYLESGRMDGDEEKTLSMVGNIGFLEIPFDVPLGHDKEYSWQLASKRAKPSIDGKSGHALLKEYKSLVENEKKEAVTQAKINYAIGDAHEFASVLKKQKAILNTNEGSEADRAKCAASVEWIEGEMMRVERLKAGQWIPVADRAPYSYQACNGITDINRFRMPRR